jgi:hypothetical protein
MSLAYLAYTSTVTKLFQVVQKDSSDILPSVKTVLISHKEY